MNLHQRWVRSTLLRVATVLGAVTLLAVGVVLTAAYFTEQSTGKGAAINLAGSLRMQSYLLATRVAERRGAADEQRAAVAGEVRAFEARFNDARLLDAVATRGALREDYAQIAALWRELRPLALTAVDDSAARDAFLQGVHPFVGRIDRFVLALENDLESRIHGLQVALGAALFLILVLIVTAFFVLDVQVFQPIKELVNLTGAVRRGRFDVRADSGEDELGQLGRDFNHMVEELGRLYGSLEAQIAAKTADLAEKNRSLSLLYETARELSSPALDANTLQRVAERLRQVLGVQAAIVCARQAQAALGLPLASAGDDAARICDQVRCDGCLDDARIQIHALPLAANAAPADASDRVITVPLLEGERLYGVLPLRLAPGQTLAPWQLELAQTVGRHLGAALAAAEARDEHRRLALLEERSAIARELHDSLAQSLSYTKIQLTRLSMLLSQQPAEAQRTDAPAQAREVVQELREGVSAAYRQLRELLTTFRLQLSGRGLSAALAEATADFTARCGVPLALDNQLAGAELSANEQIHVLQIVREALSNIEHHARAQHAWVRLHRAADAAAGVSRIEVTVEDDGRGLGEAAAKRHHFGLSIMRDRAQLLQGELDIGPRDGGGTRVLLRFAAQPAFVAPGLKQHTTAELSAVDH